MVIGKWGTMFNNFLKGKKIVDIYKVIESFRSTVC